MRWGGVFPAASGHACRRVYIMRIISCTYPAIPCTVWHLQWVWVLIFVAGKEMLAKESTVIAALHTLLDDSTETAFGESHPY
jgi:hypothetical protein